MISKQQQFEMHAAAKHIQNYTIQIMMLIEQTDINTRNARYDLICKWRKVTDELEAITMGFGEYPYTDMLIKD